MAKSKKKKFYKTIVTVEVLSEKPIQVDSLESLAYMVSGGDCSGQFTVDKTETLSGPEMAEALRDQGSDPEFFSLDDNGDSLEDDEE